MGRQYTIRSIPDTVDRVVRDRARLEGKSINAVVVEALGRGLDIGAESAGHTDLDHLVGTWQEDRDFDLAITEFGRVDDDAWK